MAIDKQIVVSALRQMGLSSGDMIGLHANVPSLGRVLINIRKQGGREALNQAGHDIIDAFVEAVDPAKGVVMVSTFSYCFAGSGNGAYNPAKSRPRVGMLAELFVKHDGAKRSLHPTHSVAAIGANSEQIIKDHEKKTPLGIDSPFHRLAKEDGWICYLGTDSKTLSLLHVAEVIGQAPYVNTFCYEYLGWKPAAMIEREDKGIDEIPLSEIPGCSECFGKFDELMSAAGIIRRGKIYQSKVILFKAKDALELAVEKLKKEPFWLLCPEGKCDACNVRWSVCG